MVGKVKWKPLELHLPSEAVKKVMQQKSCSISGGSPRLMLQGKERCLLPILRIMLTPFNKTDQQEKRLTIHVTNFLQNTRALRNEILEAPRKLDVYIKCHETKKHNFTKRHFGPMIIIGHGVRTLFSSPATVTKCSDERNLREKG